MTGGHLFRNPIVPLVAVSLWVILLGAESTRFWELTSYSDFASGTLEGLSLRSDGTLRLGPRFERVQETDSGFLWSLATDSHGNVYAAGGSPGRIYMIPPNAAPSVFFETQELEIHALAVDSQDRIYAATSPDGQIYRLSPEGTSSLFYNPGTKYIWAMSFDSKGNLHVATGDRGEIYRVDPQGQGKLFFRSEETHILSLLVDAKGTVYAGSDSNGLILRIQPDGEAFVLYESPKKEITALALDAEGNLYAAAVGDKRLAPGQPPRPAGAAAQTFPAPTSMQQVLRAPTTPATANLAGGSEVYRIAPNGSPQRVWASRDDIVYALALNQQGNLLIGTGNEGKIYQLDSGGIHSYLSKSPSSQITAFLNHKEEILVTTSNVGRIYRLRTELLSQGTFVSNVLDAGRFSQWGSLQVRQETPPGTSVRVETRSGNSSHPGLNWSPWEAARLEKGMAFSASPGARFLQWRAVFSSADASRTPTLSSAQIAYLPNNIAPVIEEVQVTPPGFRFQTAPVAAQPQPRTLMLMPLGSPAQPIPTPARVLAPAQMMAEKGSVGVRWLASDDNDDSLAFDLYIRGENEQEWKLLKAGVAEMFYSWDATNWADGTYTVKVVATDAPSNAVGGALTASRESPPLVVDNTPPEILDLECVVAGKQLKISFRAVDRGSTIQSAEFSLNGSPWRLILPLGRLSDSPEERYQFETEEVSGTEHTVAVRVLDRFGNAGVGKVVAGGSSYVP